MIRRIARAASASTVVVLSVAACSSGAHEHAAARPRPARTHDAPGAHRTAPVEPRSERVPAQLVGRVPTLLPTRRRVVALTFDAGANDAGLPKITATLRRLSVPATFFMTGHFARYYPGWARSVAARYPIGNHTMNHVDLDGLSDAQVRREVLGAQDAILRATGRRPQPLFRFPYGIQSARSLRVVNSLGYAAIGWTVDTGGWLGPSGAESVGGVITRALSGLRPGAIYLLHVGSNPNDHTTLDADALPTIIHRIEARGYSFVTLPQFYSAARRRSPEAVAPPVYCGAPRGSYVALTFDDGPGPSTAPAVALLKRFRERATFFLVGRNLASWPGLARAELAVGAVGDHTWSHPFLTRIAPARVASELARTQAALERATGSKVRLFRPPYGFHDAAVDSEAARLGMREVLWSLDSGDSYPPPGATAAEIVRTLAGHVRPGSIVLMHENLPQTGKALPAVMRLLRARGLRSVSVPELLRLDPPSASQLRAGVSGCPGHT
jgi:peptidoglycan/xylan/chitin deacetylase (PgdA/CDA1 family)